VGYGTESGGSLQGAKPAKAITVILLYTPKHTIHVARRLCIAMKHRLLILLALLIALSITGCGSPAQVRPSKGQPPAPVLTNQAAVPSPQSTTIGQILPSPLVTVIPTSGPTATPNWRKSVYADTPEGQAIVDRWQDVALTIQSIRGTQVFAKLSPDGTRQPPLSDTYFAAIGSDEWYDRLQTRDGKQVRYKVVFHNKRGDFTTLYDGKSAFRTWSWISEVYKPWPDSFASNAYWADDIDETAMLLYIFPAGTENANSLYDTINTRYHLVGRKQLDGRNVIELSITNGQLAPNGLKGTEVFLDEASYLPYRFVFHSQRSDGSGGQIATEVTFSRLDINGAVGDSDFSLNLSPSTPIIVEPAYMAPEMPKYKTIQEAQTQTNLTLFEPADGIQGELGTAYFVEMNNTRSPAISLRSQNVTIVEAAHIPAYSGDPFAQRFGDWLSNLQESVETVDLDGQQARWVTSNQIQSLIIEKGGTRIDIAGAKTKEQAIEIARGLKPVK
jgi:hypothetical protein